ncbi:hypothetical protein P280DRAFT_478987 [Massarina eburnea CBS 473.64]|uniref:Uncharacterized protein n=1 Tax=Massarina eburnea CBS 473.64 TaxID=1395130 RepID=A0A6A6S2C7_9PLEO|nr:hypothetical protein P280DRAFT_478987 [Massarina eburnea CBS 473.64]
MFAFVSPPTATLLSIIIGVLIPTIIIGLLALFGEPVRSLFEPPRATTLAHIEQESEQKAQERSRLQRRKELRDREEPRYPRLFRSGKTSGGTTRPVRPVRVTSSPLHEASDTDVPSRIAAVHGSVRFVDLANVPGSVTLTDRDVASIGDDVYAVLFRRHPDMPHDQAASYVRLLTKALTSTMRGHSTETTRSNYHQTRNRTDRIDSASILDDNRSHRVTTTTSTFLPSHVPSMTLRRRRLSNSSNLHQAYVSGTNSSIDGPPTPNHFREEYMAQDPVFGHVLELVVADSNNEADGLDETMAALGECGLDKA